MNPYRQSARAREDVSQEPDIGRIFFNVTMLLAWILVVTRLTRAMMLDTPNAINVALLAFLVLVTISGRAPEYVR